MSITPIIPLIIATSIFLGGATLLIVRHLTRPRISGPSCGNCHYDIRGLFSDVCPECGSRLSEVGILHPDSRRPLGRIGWIIVWTCTLGPIALISSPIILRQIPRMMMLQGSRQFAQPASGAYQSVSITGNLEFRAPRQLGPPPNIWARRLVLTLGLHNGSTSTMAADFDSMLSSFKDSAGKQIQRPLSFANDEVLQLVLDWYAANGIPVENPAVRQEAAEIAKAIASHYQFRNQTTAGVNPPNYFGATIRPFSSGSFSSTSFDSSKPFRSYAGSTSLNWVADPWPPRLMIAGWSMLWILGVGLILLLRRKRRVVTTALASATYTSPSSYESTLQTDSSSP